MNGDLVPAEPVLEGEVVGEPRSLVRRLGSGWQRARAVPPQLKSSQSLQYWLKTILTSLVRLPGQLLSGVGRGAVVAARAWRRWVRVKDYREAAEQSEKLADKFVEIRALTLFRWKVTGAVFGAVSAALLVLYVLYGGIAMWSAAGLASVTLAIVGAGRTARQDVKRCCPVRVRSRGRWTRKSWSTRSGTRS